MNPILFLTTVVLTQAGVSSPSASSPKLLTMAEAVRLANLNSPVLASAIADLAAARSGAKSTKSGLSPKLSANGFATNGSNAAIMSTAAGSDPTATMLVPSGSFFDGNLTMMIPLIVPSILAKSKSADWQTRAAAGELKEASADLALRVTSAYDRVLKGKQMIIARGAKVAAAKELVRTSQLRFDAGKGIEAGVQRSRAELAHAERDLVTDRNDASKAMLDLQTEMGADLGTSFELSDLPASPMADDRLEVRLTVAKRERGLLASVRARVEAAKADIRFARAQHSPQLFGTLMGDATNRSDMGGISAGLMMSIPIFDGGRIDSDVSQATSMKVKATADLRQAELTVEKEVREAWLDVQSAQQNRSSAESAVQAAASAYEVIALRVSAGKSILLEQLDALDALTESRTDLAQATYDLAVAVAKLDRATGGQR
ncbi:MAG: TolC family protein [Fimbriimonas sp.]|nr:TolC family protein [Fimbriimonas sp.]